MIKHQEIRIESKKRGFHLIDDLILEKLAPLPDQGILHLFIKHTSAGLCINENADPSVRVDFESYFNSIVKENEPFLTHTIEGPDDMPAHIKSALVGSSVSIPIINGRMHMGTWQGIYLCEFRNRATARTIVASTYS